MQTKQCLNHSWLFTKTALHATEKDAYNQKWANITLPHDWLIYNSHNLYEDSIGWYTHKLFVNFSNHKVYKLYFEGIYMDSTIYINGKKAGIWRNGYTSFFIDITAYLKEGANELLVKVVHQGPNSRWYSGAGIYRSVWLYELPQTHLIPQSIYIAPKLEDSFWHINVQAEIEGLTQLNRPILKHELLDKNGHCIVSVENVIFHEQALDQFKVSDVIAWDIDNPYLYTLKTILLDGELAIDTQYNRFGFRTIRFDQNEGFFLNNRHVKLNGVCMHHDLGALGASVNKDALRRQFAILRDMGVKAIRTSHNVPAVEFMELADETGMLVVTELYDMWERQKTPYDFARFFHEAYEGDVASWVRRDRNCPSIIMWSIGNEIYDTHADSRGQDITELLMKEVLKHDPHQHAVVTIGSNYMPWENAQKCADIVKFAGYNYAEKYYNLHHEQHPDWFIYGSETASTVQSRGIYHFPMAQSMLSDDDEQCSSLGNSSTSWGAKSTERCIIDDRDAKFSLGQFIWTGFDYIGEPTPYHTKNSYFGQVDTAGFKKDAYYIYQAAWTNYKDAPMVHLFPYWDFSEGQLIDVGVCSNAPKVELFFNEQSVGTYEFNHENGQKLVASWQIPYQTGMLKAVAYDEYGKVIAEDIQQSYGNPASIKLKADRQTFEANGKELVFVEISMEDEHGVAVANANSRVFVHVEGAGRLVGLDNGDSTDYDSYKGNNRLLFSGKLLAIIASTNEPGDVNIIVRSKGLPTSSLAVKATPASEPLAYPYLFSYDEAFEQAQQSDKLTEAYDFIPVRKIEITLPKQKTFSEDSCTLPLEVKLHPSNATDQHINWRVTNVLGVDSNIASLEANGHHAELSALGDGFIYVRAATKNGSDKVKLYSLLDFTIEGLGQAYIDPYQFVSAAYYTKEYSTDNLTNGNERGMATARDGKSIISFTRIDFGQVGAKELTLPVFSLDSDPFNIELWEGIPHEQSAYKIADLHYHKQTQWNTYQEETYELPITLSGIKNIYFVLHKKIHLKGFCFTRILKGTQLTAALNYDALYGDTFTLTSEAIEGIGNNVSIVYSDMDFGEEGVSKVTIEGESPIDVNTIHIQIKTADDEYKEIIEFMHSEGYEERTFNIRKITGNSQLTFVFLPGSLFNLKAFTFHN